MAGSLTLAALHVGGVPSPVTILLGVAAVGYVLWSRLRGQPLNARRLLVLPVVLTVIGVADLTGSSAPRLSRTDVGFLAAGVAISVVLGVARGATIDLYPNGGELWQRYRPVTVVAWVTLVAAKLALAGTASVASASPGAGTHGLLLSLGASLIAEAAVVGPRALSTGLPFARDPKDAAKSWLGRSRTDLFAGAGGSGRPSAACRWDNGTSRSPRSRRIG
jgi:hypothetical protein